MPGSAAHTTLLMDILRQLHTSVAQLFEDSFDHAYRDLNAELTRRDGRIKEAEEAHKNAAARVQELEREVADLKELIHPCEVDSKSMKFSATMQEAYGPERVLERFDGSGLDGLHPDVQGQITDISAKYRALYKHFQELIGVCGTLRAKVDSHKRKLVQWQDRVTREEFTIELSKVPVKFQRAYGASAAREDMLHAGLSRSQRSASAPLEPVAHKDKLETSTPTLNQPIIGELHGQNAQNEIGTWGVPGPSFTSEQLESASTKSDPSSTSQETTSNDLPSDGSTGTVMRELKRKRVPLPNTARQSAPNLTDSTDGRSQQPIIIKSESMSSSPLRNFSEYCPPAGTQDLDEVGSSVETPTKRNRRDRGCNNQRGSPVTEVPIATREAEQDYENPPRLEFEQNTSKRGVLQPVDGNSRAVSSSEQHSSTKRPKRNLEKTIRHDIPSLAEDGESYMNAKQIGKHTSSIDTDPFLNAENISAQQRLQSLLEGPLPSKLPLNVQRNHRLPPDHKRHVNQDSGVQRSDNSAESSAHSKIMVEGSMRTGMVHGQNSRSVDARNRPSDVRREEEPYRTRPLHRLELSHFKINPDYNHGIDYAFDDVVRKRDERECLSGCTQAGCCGDKFLAMARSGGPPTNLGGGTSQEAEERKLLEEYLGDEKDLIDTMDPHDRQELLHEARARQFSNAFGKHKHIHQRPRTPPGFWRADMPDTQELEHDREEARKFEREKVYERYREAMRPGGLWKFADE